MSEEMKEPMQTDNDCKTEEAAASTTETMADYEDHFDDANPWNLVTKYMEEKTVLPVKVEGVVNGGVIVMIEGLRGFVPASKLSLSYIEDLETYLLKEIEVQVIDADQANNRLVLSARELLKEKEKKKSYKLTIKAFKAFVKAETLLEKQNVEVLKELAKEENT